MIMFSQTVRAPTALPNYIDEYTIPTANSAPLAIAADPMGRIWFTESNSSMLGMFDPTNRTFKEYVVPGVGDMWGITVDNGGYVWLTQYSGKGSVSPGGAVVSGGHGRLLRFDPANANFTIIDIPTVGSFPFRLITDSQGRVWFTELLGNKLGIYDPRAHGIQEYPAPSSFAGPADLAFDSNGNVWFTEAYNQSLAMFQPITKKFVEYHLSTNDPSRFVSSPIGISVDQNGHVWFADHGGSWIGEFDPSSQTLTRYPGAPPQSAGYGIAIPNGLLIDKEGRVWFSEHWGNAIGYVDPTAHRIVEFPIPTGPICTALWIAEAPNGDIWFTEWSANKIGVVHSSLPIPVTFGASESHLTLAAGGGTQLSLTMKSSGDLSGNGTLKHSWSSYTQTDIAVTYSPEYPSLGNSANSTIQAQIQVSDKVTPGNYTLTVGIDLGRVRVWTILPTEVTPPPAQSGFSVAELVIMISVTAVIATILLLLRWKLRRGSG